MLYMHFFWCSDIVWKFQWVGMAIVQHQWISLHTMAHSNSGFFFVATDTSWWATNLSNRTTLQQKANLRGLSWLPPPWPSSREARRHPRRCAASTWKPSKVRRAAARCGALRPSGHWMLISGEQSWKTLGKPSNTWGVNGFLNGIHTPNHGVFEAATRVSSLSVHVIFKDHPRKMSDIGFPSPYLAGCIRCLWGW